MEFLYSITTYKYGVYNIPEKVQMIATFFTYYGTNLVFPVLAHRIAWGAPLSILFFWLHMQHSGLQLLQHKKAALICHLCELKINVVHVAKALITTVTEVHFCIFQENVIQLSQTRSNVGQYLKDIT